MAAMQQVEPERAIKYSYDAVSSVKREAYVCGILLNGSLGLAAAQDSRSRTDVGEM